MPKTASLSAGLVKKGEAAPTPPSPARTLVAAPDMAGGTVYYKALTVKLTKERYAALKTAGVVQDKKSQEILVEALDAWLKNNS